MDTKTLVVIHSRYQTQWALLPGHCCSADEAGGVEDRVVQ
jgi:hypothetical protein